MTISATDILVPACSKIPLLYLLTQKVAQKFGYVLGIGKKVPFKTIERTFKTIERIFKTIERTFKTIERNFLLTLETFSFKGSAYLSSDVDVLF